MPAPIRTLLLAGLAALALPPALLAPAQAQYRGPDAYGAGDDGQLFQDQNGALYVKRGGRYLPYDPTARPAARVAPPVQSPRQDYARPDFAWPDSAQPDYGQPGYAQPGYPSPGTAQPGVAQSGRDKPLSPVETAKARVVALPPDTGPIDHARAYAAIPDDVFPVRAFDYKRMSPAYLRQEIAYSGPYEPGTIVVDPRAHQLTLVEGNGRARRYGVGVGKQGFSWSGTATINSKQAWPDWYPPKEMIARRPDLAGQVDQLQSGVGVPGGTRNPLGARAMYLWQGNKDTLFRIHGTLEPESIGKSVSSGCIRMINQDAIDLFSRVNVGTKVVVLN